MFTTGGVLFIEIKTESLAALPAVSVTVNTAQ